MNLTSIKAFKIGVVSMVACIFGVHLEAADLLVPGQYPDIRSAYQAAATSGDRIVVDPGTYSGVQNTISNVTKSIEIVGTVTSSSIVTSTTIDLQGNLQFLVAQAPHVRIGLKNLIITNGSSSFSAVESQQSRIDFSGVWFNANSGACVVLRGADAYFKRCHFRSNTGPILVSAGCLIVSPTEPEVASRTNFEDCQFSENRNSVCLDIFRGKHAIDQTQFVGNAQAIRDVETDSLAVRDSWFHLNGVALNSHMTSWMALDGTTFMANDRVISGDQTKILLMANCVLQFNGRPGGDPVIYTTMKDVVTPALLNMHHCTLADNWSDSVVEIDGRGSSAGFVSSIRNNIFWNPQTLTEVTSNGVTDGTHDNNLIRGGGFGTNVITTNPQFVDPASADLTLRASSPAVDAGLPVLYPRIDLNGTFRGIGLPDLGAFERSVSVRWFLFAEQGSYTVYGNPGDEVHLYWGTAGKGFSTPFGMYLLDPLQSIYGGMLGTIGPDGRLVIPLRYSVDATTDSGFHSQLLVGSTLTTNVRSLYLD